MSSFGYAVAYLRNKLDMHSWNQGERMPSVGALASQCSVSISTMRKVVDELKNESLLHSVQRVGIIVGPPGTPEQKTRRARNKGHLWERLKERIRTDVLKGVFLENVLPMISKLALEYSVDVRTLGKALDSLVRDGCLERVGRRFHPLESRAVRNRSRIIIVAEKGSIPADQRSREVVIRVESECAMRGYPSRFEPFDVRDARALLNFRNSMEKAGHLQGCIISLWNPWDDTLRKRWVDLVEFLVSRKFPVLVIDLAGSLPIPGRILATGRVRVLRISSEKSGATVAAALAGAGHREVAFVFRTINESWVRDRFNGMRNYLAERSNPTITLELHTLGEQADRNDIILALLNLDKRSIQLLYHQVLTKDEITDMQKKSEQVRKMNLVGTSSRDIEIATIRHMAQALVVLAKRPHSPEVYVRELERLLSIASEKANTLSLAPLLERVLKKSKATAWVIPDEKSAIAAVDFLRNHGIRVPQDISVFGFDRWRENFEHQLSTYDFNMAGIAQQALMMIIDERTFKERSPVSEVDGYVVERSTTRRQRPSQE